MIMQSNKTSMTRLQQLAVVLVAVVGISACSSTPAPPTQELQAAELAITSAEQARVADYASAELKDARDKLDAARIAVRQEDMVTASYLASESTASAQLAFARTEMLKAREVNAEMQKNIDTLKEELQRSSGVR